MSSTNFTTTTLHSSSTPEPIRTYIIPVPGDQNIIVTSNDLPANSDELSDVLTTVNASLGSWTDFLYEYYRQNKLVEFEKLLRKTLNLRKYIILY